MLRAVSHFFPFQGSWSIKAHMTLDILIFPIIMTYFVKAGQYKLADYMKKTRNCKYN